MSMHYLNILIKIFLLASLGYPKSTSNHSKVTNIMTIIYGNGVLVCEVMNNMIITHNS